MDSSEISGFRQTNPFFNIPRPRSREHFKIAIICALARELDAISVLLDERYQGSDYGKVEGDWNVYRPGRIGHHYVVLFTMGMGIRNAATAAAHLRTSYTHIDLALLVGICGGVPFLAGREGGTETILGDVVISDSIIQYNYGRQYPNGFERKSDIRDQLSLPNRPIKTFLADLESHGALDELRSEMRCHLEVLSLAHPTKWRYLGASEDKLFHASYRHKHHFQPSRNLLCICAMCHSSKDPVCDDAVDGDCDTTGCSGSLIVRERLLGGATPLPLIRVGTIASADTVMKSGEHRDKLVEQENVIAFEMEGAGAWETLPCVIIKGVCDYADSHKSKKWQDYAAATAASCAKAFLKKWIPTDRSSRDGASMQESVPRNSGTAIPYFLFYTLTDSQEHVKRGVDSYWKHLTIKSLRIYREIYRACGDNDGLVKMSRLLEQFDPHRGPTSETISRYWNQVAGSRLKLPQNLVMAVLFMLHINHIFGIAPPETISTGRFACLKRFDDWVKCACDRNCGRAWNFADDIGLEKPWRQDAIYQSCDVANYIRLTSNRQQVTRVQQYQFQKTYQIWKHPPANG